MGQLSDLIKDTTKRRAVVDDGMEVIKAEVASKTGLRGMAVKAGFKTVQKIKPGFVGMALDMLLPEFAVQIDPFYDEWKAGGTGTLEQFFVKNDDRIANALLSITDAKSRNAKNRGVKSAYDKLRPQGVDHTKAAMPRLAGLVSRHLS